MFIPGSNEPLPHTPPEGAFAPPSFTGLTLANYTHLIDAPNPVATNSKRSREHMAQLKELEHHFEIVPVITTPDMFETALIIEEAMGELASRSVVLAGTGDGGNEGQVRACIGTGAALWQNNAGFANNLSRSLYTLRHRSDPEKVYERGKIFRTKAISWAIFDPDGNKLFGGFSADEVGFGNMAHAQLAREAPGHRDMLKAAWGTRGLKKYWRLAKALAETTRVGQEAIDDAPEFAVRFGKADPEEPLDQRPIYNFNELVFSNIGKIAWLGNIRDSRATDRKMTMVTDSYQTRLGPRLFYIKLYTLGIKGEDVPDGQTVEFDLVSDANAQNSGNPFHLLKGSHVTLGRTKKDLLVVSTRDRP